MRSETRQPSAPGPGDDIFEVVILGLFSACTAFAKLVLRLAWWGALFPMISIPAAAIIWAGARYGPAPGAVAAGVFVALLAGWRMAAACSFRHVVSGRLAKVRRLRRVYQKPWRHLCALHGLTVVLNEQVLVPRLHKVKVGEVSDVVTVQMLYGQTVADWQRNSDALAHAFGALGVRVRAAKPGWVTIDVHHTDVLAEPIPVPFPKHRDTVDAERLQVGATEQGTPWFLRLLGRHVLVAGATGAGKGSVVWSTLTALAPAVKSGLAELWVIDPKGGMEFGPGAPLFARFAHDAGEGTVHLLQKAAAVLTARAARLRGVTRLHTPTADEPLIVVVIDEIATLTAYTGDRKIRAEIEQLLGLILSQGRAVGVSVIAAVQDPSKDVLAMRQLFPTRIALRLSEPSQVAMVLGEAARDRGGLCDQIPDGLPGVGYVAQDDTTELQRVRAFHVTDDDIARLCHEFAPTVRPFVSAATDDSATAA